MAIVNLGILAHVDAGKTSLTERLLFTADVIKTIGSVDHGTTQTDTLALERARGITIKSAVVSFQLPDRKINLIDTPGHSDFVAEVERSLRVLDAVILVVSAVEGVQSQTKRLYQAIQAAGLPCLIFVNKVDRLGARGLALLGDLQRRLGVRPVAITAPDNPGERNATVVTLDRTATDWRDTTIDLLAETNEGVIAEYERTGGEISTLYIEGELRRQVACGTIAPVFFGSAITGVGVPELLAGLADWLPTTSDATTTAATGTVFKITRHTSGEKLVYLRLFTGSLAVRQRITLHRPGLLGDLIESEERITTLETFAHGAITQVEQAAAGEIVVLHGVKSARIGDTLGAVDPAAAQAAFPRPTLESVVQPVEPGQITQLRTALEHLAEQDPLIALRQRNEAGAISVRLFGEVQKEVLTDTLQQDYGVAVTFGASQTICIERPTGTGEAFELIRKDGNPFYATLGFRVEPGPAGSGLTYHRELGSLLPAFYRAVEETLYETLPQGLYGWDVTDCQITLTHTGYWAPLSTGTDFRRLTPLVLMAALQEAGTEVCEPLEHLALEIPEDTFGAVCGLLINARAIIGDTARDELAYHLTVEIPTAELRAVEQQLPGLTRGEGSWSTTAAGYRVINDDVPHRKRLGPNPLNRAQYLADVAQGIT